MWDKFGEFDTFAEINELAENLFNEGDLESIKILAKENGIPADFAEMYVSGDIPTLTDAATAAAGKLEIEAKNLKIKGLMKDWKTYIASLCMEHEEIAMAVRRKSKSLEGCIAEILKYSFANQWTVPSEIMKAAGVKAGKVTFGVPDMAKAKELIKDYYTGSAGGKKRK